MKSTTYLLSSIACVIVNFIIIITFHNNNNLFVGNEVQQVKFISSIFYVIFSFKIFIILLPLLMVERVKTVFLKKIIILLPMMLIFLLFLRISLTKYNGNINIHLKVLEYYLESVSLIAYFVSIYLSKFYSYFGIKK